MRQIKGQTGQSIYDIALQLYGDPSGVASVLSDNTDLIQSAAVAGVDINVTDGGIINQRNVDEIFSIKNPVSN